jgi:hypothetical protein
MIATIHSFPPPLAEKFFIVIIVSGAHEVGQDVTTPAKRFAVADLLQAIQATGDPAVPVGIECEESDRGTAVLVTA